MWGECFIGRYNFLSCLTFYFSHAWCICILPIFALIFKFVLFKKNWKKKLQLLQILTIQKKERKRKEVKLNKWGLVSSSTFIYISVFIFVSVSFTFLFIYVFVAPLNNDWFNSNDLNNKNHGKFFFSFFSFVSFTFSQ